MTRRPGPEALREAARVARDEGVTVRLERDGWVYLIGPAAQDARAMTASDRDRDRAACDEAFGI